MTKASTIPRDHETALLFIDESGSISNDRFFAVGCLHLQAPSRLLRQVQTYRDRLHDYREFKFSLVKRRTLSRYKGIVDLVTTSGATFSCFVADRDSADPVKRFGSTWSAYEKLATQLIIGAIRPPEVTAVLADNYSTPASFDFEGSVKSQVNRRLGRLAVLEVLRLDSTSSDALQLVDLLTSAVAFEYRASAGQGSASSPKGELSAYVRTCMNVPTFIGGCTGQMVSVREYEDENWRRRRRRRGKSL